MKKFSSLLLLLTISLNATLIYAGWHIVEEEVDQSGISNTSKIWIEKGKFKHTEGNFDFIYEEEEGIISYINNKSKTYWKGDVAKFKEEIEVAKKAIIDQTMAKLPPEQREKYKKLMEEQKKATENQEKKEIDIVVTNTGVTEKILGFKTVKYEVIVDGELKEELWISKDNDFYKDIDYDKFNKIMNEMSQASIDDYTSDEKYTSIFKNTFPMKKVVYGEKSAFMNEANKTTTEVKSAVNEKISDDVFKVPDNFKKVSLADFMTQ